MSGRSRWPGRLGVALLGFLAYLPALLSSPGLMPADTKLYLYLDPGRLIGDAPFTFDARQFAGWVPHQVIAYLWPQGPWYWLGDQLGLPDWIVHRLWIGTLLFLAGCGAVWCARRLGLGIGAALAAGLVYQVSPYVLPYVSRTSAMLLPWAGLGWIVGLTVLAGRRGGWRHPALIALVVASIGAVNATALLMIVPAPALWLVVAIATRELPWRRALAATGRIALLCLVVSAWWIGAVVVQGREGADVLSFSETLRAVSRTSSAPEVWRAMGYWLGYIVDHVSATTTAALAYVTEREIMLASFLVPLAGIAGLTTTRFAARRYAVALVVTGVVLAVGVHPIDDPSPLMGLLAGPEADRSAALALRSSTRAIPVLLLGLGLGVGALVDAAGTHRRAARRWFGLPGTTVVALAAVLLMVVAAMPALRRHQLVDPSLQRDQDVPLAWQEAAGALDALPPGYRVMALPGMEFGAFRWGVTVDPPLPGLTDRPLVTRDLLPLGSAPAMDLLWAFDNRFQDGVAERAAVAPVARLFGVDRLWLMGDAAFERYRTPRPELTSAFFADAGEGLGTPVPYGAATTNVSAVPTIDETSVSDPRVGTPVAPVELVPVVDPVPVVRAKAEVVLVAGSGDGVVDAAAAGLLDGTELIRYTGSLTDRPPEATATAVAGADRLIVTDSARDRDQSWTGSQDATGFTESAEIAGRDGLDPDGPDVRLEVFGPDTTSTLTDAVQDGPVTARATGYGDPFSYRPEDRPVMAIDGNPDTAWRVAERFDAVGHRLVLTTDGAVDHVTLRQPAGAGSVRHISAVAIRVETDGRAWYDELIGLDDRSLANGQRIELRPANNVGPPEGGGTTTVSITITEVAAPDPRPGPALAAVGFAEADLGLGPTIEVVRVANDLAAADGDVAAAVAGLDTSYVFTRLRTDPLDRWRSDPEPELVRTWQQVATDPAPAVAVTVRLDRRAGDAVLAEALGIDGARSDGRATGAVTAAGWAATDGSPATAWISPFADAVGRELTFELARPTSTVRFSQPVGAFSPITSVRVRAGTVDVTAPVVVGPDNVATVDLGTEVPAGPVLLSVVAIAAMDTLDRRYGEPVPLPAAISEIEGAVPTRVPVRVEVGCRDDLLTIDGAPVPLAFEGSVEALLAGEPLRATICGTPPALAAGDRRLATTAAGSGWTIDRVVVGDGAPTDAADGAGPTPTATVTAQDRLSRTITVTDCPDGCWLVVGEGFHARWSARTEDGSLGAPELVDGGFNGWWIAPTDAEVEVTVRWEAQRPLTLALLAAGLGAVACLGIVVATGRWARRPQLSAAVPAVEAPDGPGAAWAFPGDPIPGRRRIILIASWAIAAAVLVGPSYGLLAIVAGGVLVGVVGRPRLAGLLTFGLLLVTVAAYNWVVLHEPPLAPYDFPGRFERLHRVALFAAISLGLTALGGHRRERP